MHSLVSLADFKRILGIDDRDDACYPEGSLSRYCLVTATYGIERHCRRRLLRKKLVERLEFLGDPLLPLREYPVREILAVHLAHPFKQPELVGPDFYHTVPDCQDLDDVPFILAVSPGLRMARGMSALKISYWAGYRTGEVPADLASACVELAAWNMARFRGRKIGVTGPGGKMSGEHLEPSMPENARLLLEPYRRKMI